MNMSPQQNERLHFAVRNLRRTAEFGFIHQLLVAETAKPDADLPGLKAHIMEIMGVNLQYEIEGVTQMRSKSMAVAP